MGPRCEMPAATLPAEIAADRVIVLMGVSGSGKTTVGEKLAERLHLDFQEGDDFHPASNIAKMRAGVPLDDADREPWLAALAGWIGREIAAGRSGVLSCSALRRAYRDRLRSAGGEHLRFVLLDPGEAVLRARLAERQGHFMPASLLSSQLATLERPTPDEQALVVSGDRSTAASVDAVVDWLTPPDIATHS